MSARFITLEGIDGAGKSTHMATLAAHLSAAGAEVVATREPGGTPLAEQLRDVLLLRAMDSLTEVLLVFAARRDHLRQVIEPALARGATVLCDRFTDATFAYQGAGRGFDPVVIAQLERWVQGARQPDLTLWFDAPPHEAARRRMAERGADRFEREDAAFFERVRAGYTQRCADAPRRVQRIDATGTPTQVWERVAAVLEGRGW